MRVESRERTRNSITRKDLFTSLTIGLFVGAIAGTPIGWFAHKFYAQQHAAQVLLCRQNNFGQTEAQLQQTCGSLY